MRTERADVIFAATRIRDAFLVTPEPHHDERGFFARTWCEREFVAHGLNPRIAQCSISFNPRRGTLRGMHYQVSPFEEAKLVRCTSGAIYDVLIDLRPDSATYLGWFGAELTADDRTALYVPEGCAHGFLTLSAGTEVLYQISEFHSPEHARGVRYDDPAFEIEWPSEIRVIGDRDRTYPDFGRARSRR